MRFLSCLLLLTALPLGAEEARFHRAVNLNGPALTIDGRAWEAGAEAKDFRAEGKTFANPSVPLRPPAGRARAEMIRSSVWGDGVKLEFSAVPAGRCQVFLYVWEDNLNEKFDVLVNGRVVVEGFQSGTAGMWRRLGPFAAESADGKLRIEARAPQHGAANLSGVELWLGDGPVPEQTAAFVSAPSPEQTEFFEKRVRPVLAEHCYACHSAQAKHLRGGLLLDSRAGIQKGGESGAVIVPGEPDASLLIAAVQHENPGLTMPEEQPKLPADAIAALEEWVRMGAPDPRSEDTVAAVKARDGIDWAKAREWWSLRPLTPPAVPAVQDTAWPANDLDRFILAKLEQSGLRPAPDAEPRTLIRRLSYDLTGLPPSPEEVEEFVNTCASSSLHHALATLIDRLLASPHYGERWGRHWLDVVRYADTAGDNSDFPIPQMHRYRDWVIAAFNRDLPYDQFVREQLAGDLLGGEGDERFQRIIATGYIANARRFGSRVDDYPQHLTIEDTLDNVGRAFLGLSVNCARCHDHKFDPITAEDYYALYGIFSSTRYPWPGIELEQRQRDLVPLVAPDQLAEAEKAKQQRAQEIGRLDKAAQQLRDELKSVPGPVKKAHEEKIKAAERAVAEAKSKPPPFATAYAVAEGKAPGDAVLQMKGDPAKPGAAVPRRFLTVLGGAALPPDHRGSGRKELADWIFAADNPLPARVMANRIWQGHFGRGLVPTPNDFGKQGKPCTHPELLDWLALRLRTGGWSIKALHREILLSRTWRMAAQPSAEALARDPANQQLSFFPRRRMDAESLRDTLLQLGGTLDPAPPAAHPFPPESEWKFTQHNPFKAVYDSPHRSVYLMTQRIQRHPFLSVFDGADPSASTPQRAASTSPVQALFLLNDPLLHEQSAAAAARIMQHSADETTRLHRTWLLLFSRPPAADELDRAQSFLSTTREKLHTTGTSADKLETETWTSLIRSLFRVNEFIYLD